MKCCKLTEIFCCNQSPINLRQIDFCHQKRFLFLLSSLSRDEKELVRTSTNVSTHIAKEKSEGYWK